MTYPLMFAYAVGVCILAYPLVLIALIAHLKGQPE